MTDTRYSAEALDLLTNEVAWNGVQFIDIPACLDLIAQAKQGARDAETLAGIRAWLVKSQSEPCACLECASYRNAIAELDRLSRGDA